MLRFFSFFLFALIRGRWPPSRPTVIWSARYVITMDAQRRVIENGAVAIRGDRIVGRRHQGRNRRALPGRSSASTAPTPSSRPA